MKEDNNLNIIKKVIREIVPNSQMILFGSRSRGEASFNSDYDILISVKHNLDFEEKRSLGRIIRKRLALIGIDVDIIVKTENDVEYYKDKIGSIVREALKEGLSI